MEDCRFCDVTTHENPVGMNSVPSVDCLFLLMLRIDDFMK